VVTLGDAWLAQAIRDRLVQPIPNAESYRSAQTFPSGPVSTSCCSGFPINTDGAAVERQGACSAVALLGVINAQ
jgi:hypothetical protein